MLPFFRPDPAWQSSRTQQQTPPGSPGGENMQVSNDDNPTPIRSGMGGLLARKSHRNNNYFRDEEPQRHGRYYENLISESSGSSKGDELDRSSLARSVSQNSTLNDNNNTSITAAQLEWVRNEHGQGTRPRPVVTGIPADPPSRPGTPVTSNNNRNSTNPSSGNDAPLSPSEKTPHHSFPIVPPHQVEDETIINSALAEAWFARRREQRMEQMLMYNPPPPPAPLTAPSPQLQHPMMDPRTGGFQRGPPNPPPTHVFHYMSSLYHPYQHSSDHHAGPLFYGPVDVDTGTVDVDTGYMDPPTAQVVVLRNPFEDHRGSSDGAVFVPHVSAQQRQHPYLHPHYVPRSAAYDNSADSSTVVSGPSSLASFPSVTPSEATRVASNVTFAQKILGGGGHYADSSRLTNSTSAAYMNNNLSYGSDPHQQHFHGAARSGDGGERGDGYGGHSHHHQQSNSKDCCGCFSSADNRKSCRGFLDVRTYHGKLAILLVTILVLAIGTMVVSATMTYKSNQNSNRGSSAVVGGPFPSDSTATKTPSVAPPSPQLSPSPTVSRLTRTPSVAPMSRGPVTNSTTTTTAPSTAPPTSSPSAKPSTAIPTHQPSNSPTTKSPSQGPTHFPTMFPTQRPTHFPTMFPTQGPTSVPTHKPSPNPTMKPTKSPTTDSPTTATPTGQPSPSPTAPPTDSLDDFILPQVTTIMGPAPGSFFGTAVALSRSGDVLAVGAPEHLNRRGTVTILAASSSTQQQWETRDILEGEFDGQSFGFDVSLSRDGEILAVGASGGNGTVYTYVYNRGRGEYVLIGEPIRSGSSDASFGFSVALSLDGFRLVAGGPYASVGVASLNGLVRAYELQGNSWSQMGTDLVGSGNIDWLGSAVDISADGDMIISSAPKNRSFRGYVRAWTWNGSDWVQTGPDMINSVAPAFSTDRFGHSIALSKERDTARVAIGIPWKTVNRQKEAGLAVVYELDGVLWKQLGSPIQQTNPQPLMENGNAVDLDGGILSVGIPGHNGTGAVAFYRFLNGSWQMRTEMIKGNATGDDFGVALSSHRETSTDGYAVVVGALMDGSDGPGYVASYVKKHV